MKFDDTELSLENAKLKFTVGLKTSLFLNGLGFWDLQPKYAFLFGGAEGFCKAWSVFMGVKFDGNCDEFYKHFDFDITEKSDELTTLIISLVDRDIEPVIKIEPKCDAKAERKKHK